MILYHGSTVIVETPRIIKSGTGRDFGNGFYTTDIKTQAERWATRKAKLARRSGRTANAYVCMYEFDESAYTALKYINFAVPSMEWLKIICDCRSNVNYSHEYDIVEGKIADDTVGETVSYVLRGIMRKEDAVERLKFEQINNQICFNTNKSLQYLKYIGCEQLN